MEESPFALTWLDGATRRYHPLMLAKNDPSSATLHPMSRETTLSPSELPDDLMVVEAHIENNRTIPVQWSHEEKPADIILAGWRPQFCGPL